MALKVSSIKPGRTPGVATPGDESYKSELCRTKPRKILDQEFISGPPSNNRRLLSRKKRPAAWEAPHMNSDDLEEIKNLVMTYSNSSKICTFLSRPCVEAGYEYHVRKGQDIVKKRFSDEDVSKFPYIESGSWGSCALVGFADILLSYPRGRDIDRHDTVIRMGEKSVRSYKDYVGKKTDITWIRRRSKMAPRGSMLDERKGLVRMYIGHNNGIPDMPTLRVATVSKDLAGSESYLPERLYKLVAVKNWNKGGSGKSKDRVASTGFKYAISLIFSRFCKRIDLYGMSSNCGAAYYKPEHLMQLQHNCELESWFLHHLMQQYEYLSTCVYL